LFHLTPVEIALYVAPITNRKCLQSVFLLGRERLALLFNGVASPFLRCGALLFLPTATLASLTAFAVLSATFRTAISLAPVAAAPNANATLNGNVFPVEGGSVFCSRAVIVRQRFTSNLAVMVQSVNVFRAASYRQSASSCLTHDSRCAMLCPDGHSDSAPD
jgi:hypothetical protein